MLSGFVVLFDACVLYPAPVRDLLLELAAAGLFRAKWTERIHDEWIQNLLRKRPDLISERLERTRKLINESVEDCLIEEYEHLCPQLNLPDPDDRHVLAAAIKGQAQMIVTYNLKDFPANSLEKYGLEAQHPDDFFLNQSDLHLPAFLSSVKNCRNRMKTPSKTSNEYLGIMRKHSLAKTVEFLNSYIELI